MEQEWLAWIGLFDSHVTTLSSLCDGVVISRILHEIAPAAFDIEAIETSTDGWSARFQNLTYLHSAVTRYLNSQKGCIQWLNSPDLTLIARDGDVGEVQKFLQQVLLVSFLNDKHACFAKMDCLSGQHAGTLSQNLDRPTNLPFSKTSRYHGLVTATDGRSTNSSRTPARCKAARMLSQEISRDMTMGSPSSHRSPSLTTSVCPRLDQSCSGHDMMAPSPNMELQQLDKQYRELQTQFHKTEEDLAAKVIECAEHVETIAHLRGRLASKDANVRSEERAIHAYNNSEEQLMVRIQALERANLDYKRKLEQKTSDICVYEERLSQLELANKNLLDTGTKKETTLRNSIASLEQTMTQYEALIEHVRPEKNTANDDHAALVPIVLAMEAKATADRATPDHDGASISSRICTLSTKEDKAIDASADPSESCARDKPAKVAQAANDELSELRQQLALQTLELRVLQQQLTDLQGPNNLIIENFQDYLKKSPYDIKSLLRRQDALIQSYRNKYEALLHNQNLAAIRAEEALKEQKFNIYRQVAEARLMRMKREKDVMAKTFFDLAARLHESNQYLLRAIYIRAALDDPTVSWRW